MDWDDSTLTDAAQPAVVVQQSRLGWVAFGVALLGLTAAMVGLVVRSRRDAATLSQEYVLRTRAEARAEQAEKALAGQTARVDELDGQLKQALAERDRLQREQARAQAAPPAADPPRAKKAKKAASKKKKHRRR